MLGKIICKLQRLASESKFMSAAQVEGSCKIYENVMTMAADISVGDGFSAYSGALFWGDGPIRLGKNVSIGMDTIIYAHSGRHYYRGQLNDCCTVRCD